MTYSTRVRSVDRTRQPGQAGVSGAWRAAQAMALLTAVSIVFLLFVRPAVGLWLTWGVLIPFVPAVLLIAPQLWRNLCPIAFVSQWPAMADHGGARRLSRGAQRTAPAIAALLLLAIVPLRLVVFNHNGPALASFVLSVLALAALGGWLVPGKGGWCATYCPVLPVERLYGQAPLADLPHAHCTRCAGCVGACYDLQPRASLVRLTKRSTAPDRSARAPASLIGRPMGTFAAAFPGFIAGFFTAPQLATLLEAYGFVIGGSLLSVLLVAALQRLLRLTNQATIRVAGATAIAIYYWFAVPGVASAAHDFLALPPAPGTGITLARILAIAAAVVWFILATRRSGPRPAGC